MADDPTPATKAGEIAVRGAHAATAALVTYSIARYIGHLDDHGAVEVATLTAGVAYYESRAEGAMARLVNRLTPRKDLPQ